MKDFGMKISSLDNPKYKEMTVKTGTFIPDIPIDFPVDDPAAHLLEPAPALKEIAFDDTYPYLDDSFDARWQMFKCYFGLELFGFLVNKIRYGVKVVGRSKMRKYRKLFKNGAMTVCNHVYRWDYVSILWAIRHHRLWAPMYAPHFRGKDAWFMRSIGGIPIPEERSGLRRFNEAFDELHRRKEWIHVFPESCRWDWYTPIRSFKPGAFNMAYKYGIPVIPLVISYRERKGIYKLFGDESTPLVTISVGDPLIPDTNANRKEEVARLGHEAHARMVEMAGIIHNPWPAE